MSVVNVLSGECSDVLCTSLIYILIDIILSLFFSWLVVFVYFLMMMQFFLSEDSTVNIRGFSLVKSKFIQIAGDVLVIFLVFIAIILALKFIMDPQDFNLSPADFANSVFVKVALFRFPIHIVFTACMLALKHFIVMIAHYLFD